MKKKEILDLLEIMDEGQLSALRYDDGKIKIELERQTAAIPVSAAGMAERVRQLINADSASSGVTEGATQAPLAGEEEGVLVVRSPMVGTFYTAPSPDEAPFVKTGQEVITGQTLCIVEAMKMMNEITAPAPGIITEVLAANASQVEYDQPLFRLQVNA